MRFKKVTIENFKSVGSEPIVVDLSFNDTKLLTGRNGAGKSTIFEGIAWCIYGISKLKADNVVNKLIGSGTKVEVEFSENGKDYVITRYRKHPTHKNNIYVFENGNNITLKNQADTQELIQKIVGVDARAFMSSIILSSETYKQFLRETNSTRLQIFESVFSLRELNDLSKLNKIKIKEIEKQFSDKQSELISLKSYIESDSNVLKNYKENYNNQINNYNNQISECEKLIESYKNSLSEYDSIDFEKEMKLAIEEQRILSNYSESLNNYENDLKTFNVLKNHVSSLESKIKNYEEFKNTYTTEYLKEQIAICNSYSELEKRQADIVSEINNISYEILNIKNRISQFDIDKRRVENKISELKLELEKINSNKCPTCGQIVSSGEIEQIKNRIMHELQKNIDELTNISSEHSSCSESLNIAQKNKENLQSEMNEISNKKVKPELDISEIKSCISEIKRIDSELPLLKEEFILRKDSLDETQKKIDSYNLAQKPDSRLEHNIDWLNNARDEITNLNNKIEIYSNKIKMIEELKQNAFDKVFVSKTLKAINDRNEIVNKINSEILSIRKDYNEYLVLDEVFSNGENGFKKYFIENTISLFNEKINTFLPFFFEDQIEITFDKNLNDTIVFRGKEADFDELSSGEKTRCEMCVIFSLYFMVQSLFGCGTNLLAIDEILDRGLDEPGIKASKQILDDISSNSAVFVITHRDDLKEMFKYTLTVYKDGDGFTKIK